MARHSEPYTLITRDSGYWYYKLEKCKSYKSTGIKYDGTQRSKSEAKKIVLSALTEEENQQPRSKLRGMLVLEGMDCMRVKYPFFVSS